MSSFERALQPGARHRPLALHRGWRDADDLRRFLDGETTEVAQLDDACLLRIDRCKPRQRLVNSQYVEIAWLLVRNVPLVQRDAS